MNYSNGLYIPVVTILLVAVSTQGMENKKVETFKRSERRVKFISEEEHEQGNLANTTKEAILQRRQQFARYANTDKTVKDNTK